MLFVIGSKRGNNKILTIFWVLICVLSYDNVTDYSSYVEYFRYFLLNGFNPEDGEKGRSIEIGWGLLHYIFSFTEYGMVICQSLIMGLVTYVYFAYSRKVNLLPWAILLYFLLDLIILHDNIKRQDIAICIACYVFHSVLNERLKIKRKLIRVIGGTFFAFLFHYSALFLVPLYSLLIHLLSRIKLDFKIVLPFVVGVGLFFYSETGHSFVNLLSVVLYATDVNYLQQFSNTMQGNLNEVDFTLWRVIYAIIYCFPLVYFQVFAKEQYSSNRHLRVCVNLSWLVFVWKQYLIMFGSTIFTRPADYLIWFAVWGYAYMLRSIYSVKKNSVPSFVFLVFFICIISLIQVRRLYSYFGDNDYLTVFSNDCINQKYYPRGTVEFNEKRWRR